MLAIGALALVSACGSDGPSPITPPPVIEPPPPPPPPPPTPPPVLAITRILAFGDSMTEGVDSPPLQGAWSFALDAGRSQSYPFKLQALTTALYTAQTVEVFNAGLAGRQARDDRGRFGRALGDANPELVLLMEGANDLNGPLAPGEGINARVQSIVDALEDMVRDASLRGIPVMIATLPPQRPPKGGGAEYLPRFNDALRSMAGKKGAQVVEIANLPASLIGLDGLHPSEPGYQRIAELWFDAIRGRFERVN